MPSSDGALHHALGYQRELEKTCKSLYAENKRLRKKLAAKKRVSKLRRKSKSE